MVYKIINIITKGELGFKINLNSLALNLDNTEYEPEKFPGLIYRLINPKATFIIYSSGKFMCMGLKREEEIEKAIEQVKKDLARLKSTTHQ